MAIGEKKKKVGTRAGGGIIRSLKQRRKSYVREKRGRRCQEGKEGWDMWDEGPFYKPPIPTWMPLLPVDPPCTNEFAALRIPISHVTRIP